MSENRVIFEMLALAESRGEIMALATVVHVQGSVPRHEGSKMLVKSDGQIIGTVGGGAMEGLVIKTALEAMRDGKTRFENYVLNDLASGDPGVCGGTVQVFIEPFGVSPTLLVIGGGHVGKALAELAKWMSYRVILSDDRQEFCNPDYVPGLEGYIVCSPADVTQHIVINERTFIAAVTRGLPVDVHLIPRLLETPAAYIGLIGSRRRWALTVKALQDEQGIDPTQLNRVYAPIGLELQAETPQEIALSIMAQITMLRRGGSGESMKVVQGNMGQAE